MFFWKNRKKKQPAPLVPPTATAQELETTYKSHWRGKNFRSPEWQALGVALAQHPNISPEFLKELIYLFPHAGAENPALPLILLEDPNFFSGISQQVLLRWLQAENTPAILVQGLLSHPTPSIARAACYHVAIAGEADSRWLARVQAHFRSLPLLPKQEWYLAELALQNQLPLWLREQLAGSRNGEIRAIALKCPELGSLRDLLIRASGCPDLSRLGPAASGKVSVPELIKLARGPYWFRVLAARHPHTPPWCLAALLDDPDGFLRVRVLRNPATPPELLRRYASSPIEAERIAVARNPACPAAALALLQSASTERIETVRKHKEAAWAAARPRQWKKERRLPLSVTAARRPVASPFHNPQLTSHELNTLADHEDRDIRRRAMRRGGMAKQLWKLRLAPIKLPEVVEIAYHRDHAEIRSAAQSIFWEARLIILANPLLTYELIKELAQDGHQWIRAAARARLATGQPLDLFGMIEFP